MDEMDKINLFDKTKCKHDETTLRPDYTPNIIFDGKDIIVEYYIGGVDKNIDLYPCTTEQYDTVWDTSGDYRELSALQLSRNRMLILEMNRHITEWFEYFDFENADADYGNIELNLSFDEQSMNVSQKFPGTFFINKNVLSYNDLRFIQDLGHAIVRAFHANCKSWITYTH